jgi:hypothetical protein
MRGRSVCSKLVLAFAIAPLIAGWTVHGGDERPSGQRVQIHLDPGHPWRPPFGLEKIGRPVALVLESPTRPPSSTCRLTAFAGGKETSRSAVSFPHVPPYKARVLLTSQAELVVLSSVPRAGEEPAELARQAILIEPLEADAVARAENPVNPVDLGTILVPSGWLLVVPGQAATLEAAAISRTRDWPVGRLSARFESAPEDVKAVPMPLRPGKRVAVSLKLPAAPSGRDRDQLLAVLDDGAGHELWRKSFRVMLVQKPPRRPQFGATYERLRYDAPISVRDPKTGKYSTLKYEDGWKSGLLDVVVRLPGGGRFVFWRGSSYIPFWAGRQNTGFCYEWAEIISQPPGAVDCVEPLMDKELRYGRVEIVESTSARVHVRWTYQSTDFEYKVWGDQAVEDYYFYPDGFGTRVLTLEADPRNDYELSEFIILTPAGAYPFDVLPVRAVDALFLDGRKHEFHLPNPAAADPATKEADKPGVPAIYRIRFARNDDDPVAIYFNPGEPHLPPTVFAPFTDGGQVVTPCYWGSHWPLARGNSTGWAIDDRIGLTPCHNSVLSWAGCRPEPIQSARRPTLDAQGKARSMSERRWAWLIGTSAESDARLVERAKSFAALPDLDLQGARVSPAGYAIERRAICLEGTAREIQITIKPRSPCVNPVFEFEHAPPGTIDVSLGGKALNRVRYAWDGRTLWLDSTITAPSVLRLTFRDPAALRR